jgi:hypothetical protein
MQTSVFARHLNGQVEIDICWPCHLIWFDHLESAALSADSVIDLFRRIHAHRSDQRNLVSLGGPCPTCIQPLQQAWDFSRGGRFQYYRCPSSHGRAISFTQFLREKNFVRSLTPSEIKSLCATIKQVRCSSCGAGINIEKDQACTHCGSPVSVLDRQAVDKALAEYDQRRQHGSSASPSLATPAASVPKRTPESASGPIDWSGYRRQEDELSAANITDLVLTGIAAIIAIAGD